MKNTKSRVYNFFGVTFNMTAVLLFVIFIISYLRPAPGIASKPTIARYESRGEYKFLIFSPNIDLTPQFTFNTKQVFLYLTCKSSNKEEMAWSKIVTAKDNLRLFERVKSNYIFTGSRDRSARFELRGNVYPYVGQMVDLYYGEVTFNN